MHLYSHEVFTFFFLKEVQSRIQNERNIVTYTIIVWRLNVIFVI